MLNIQPLLWQVNAGVYISGLSCFHLKYETTLTMPTLHDKWFQGIQCSVLVHTIKKVHIQQGQRLFGYDHDETDEYWNIASSVVNMTVTYDIFAKLRTFPF